MYPSSYATVPSLTTTLPRFQDSFASPPPMEHNSPKAFVPSPTSTSSSAIMHYHHHQQTAPLHHHRQQYPSHRQQMDLSSQDRKRKHFHPMEDEPTPLLSSPNKRVQAMPTFISGRQRQESGSSVSSTSSWGSAASFSSTTSSTCPPLMYEHGYPHHEHHHYQRQQLSSPRQLTPSSPQEQAQDPSRHLRAPSATLSDLVFAIALDASLTSALQSPKSEPARQSSVEHEESDEKAPLDPHALRIVYCSPTWLQDHMARAKLLALKQANASGKALTPISL